MPPPPPPTHDDLYAHLITALHPSPPTVTAIEILPSNYPPEILHEPPAIGIPKSLLIPLFLQARATFNHVSSPDSTEAYHPALQATAIILLFDPNHITAANFRKRHVLRVSGGRKSEDGRRDEKDVGCLVEAVRLELRFLESLVTSPLSKHAKSSTLWAQRLWVVRNFSRLAMREHGTADDDVEGVQMVDRGHIVRGFWDGELGIVMKAGERHPRNYYAWQYARQLFSYVCSEHPGQGDWCGEVLHDSIGLVHRWCLMHPRDVSGWAFLVFLLEQSRSQGCDEGDKRNGSKDEMRVSASETREFARKYEWKGESIEWFLNAIRTLDIDY